MLFWKESILKSTKMQRIATRFLRSEGCGSRNPLSSYQNKKKEKHQMCFFLGFFAARGAFLNSFLFGSSVLNHMCPVCILCSPAAPHVLMECSVCLQLEKISSVQKKCLSSIKTVDTVWLPSNIKCAALCSIESLFLKSTKMQCVAFLRSEAVSHPTSKPLLSQIYFLIIVSY